MSTALIQLSKGKKALVSFGAIMLTVAVACYGLALMTLVPPILQRLDDMAFAGLVACASLWASPCCPPSAASWAISSAVRLSLLSPV